MSDRPTPETDAEEFGLFGIDYGAVKSDFARRLERERDEARERLAEVLGKSDRGWMLIVATKLAFAGCKSDGIVDAINEVVTERDELRAENERLRVALSQCVVRLKFLRNEDNYLDPRFLPERYADEAFVIAREALAGKEGA